MRPNLARVLYHVFWLLAPVSFTSFLTFYDLRNFVSSNSVALINVVNVSVTSETELPIIIQLVTYYLNNIASVVMWGAMISAGLFRFIYLPTRSYSRAAFPAQARLLRKRNGQWMWISVGIVVVVVIYLLFPLANQLLLAGKVANALTLPAFILAITGALGPIGTAISSLCVTIVAILHIISMFLPTTIGVATFILFAIFVVTYYCVSLAFSFVVLPRVSAPLSTDMAVVGVLRKGALSVVGWFLKHGLDALNGPDGAAIITEVIDGAAGDSALN